jgi:hypothetical protein
MDKNNLKKNHNKKEKKENKTLWIIIVIHSAMDMGEQWFPYTL